ncbi:MAG: hypothetical protein CSA50_02245 [Gammaproteobacteria bacterium]|nr:MAG: hypothetical protein CSA50_02245 [Gammaproteobacteria bacterium]
MTDTTDQDTNDGGSNSSDEPTNDGFVVDVDSYVKLSSFFLRNLMTIQDIEVIIIENEAFEMIKLREPLIKKNCWSGDSTSTLVRVPHEDTKFHKGDSLTLRDINCIRSEKSKLKRSMKMTTTVTDVEGKYGSYNGYSVVLDRLKQETQTGNATPELDGDYEYRMRVVLAREAFTYNEMIGINLGSLYSNRTVSTDRGFFNLINAEVDALPKGNAPYYTTPNFELEPFAYELVTTESNQKTVKTEQWDTNYIYFADMAKSYHSRTLEPWVSTTRDIITNDGSVLDESVPISGVVIFGMGTGQLIRVTVHSPSDGASGPSASDNYYVTVDFDENNDGVIEDTTKLSWAAYEYAWAR